MTEAIDIDAEPGCQHCIGGMTLSHSGLLGPCFRVCPACYPACPCCHGHGCFPALTHDMTEFIACHNDAGFLPVLCHTCGGVVDLRPQDEESPP